MIVEIPFRYKAKVRLRGSSAAYVHSFDAMHSVLVPDLTAEDAPVCARWEDIPTYNPIWAVLDGVQEVRKADGAMYALASHLHGPLLQAHLVRLIAEGWQRGPQLGKVILHTDNHPQVHRKTAGSLMAADDPRLLRVLDSDRDDRIRCMNERAAQLLLVDGRLWIRVPEPRYVVYEKGLTVWMDDTTWETAFPIDDYDGALALVRSHNPSKIPSSVTVLDPSAFDLTHEKILQRIGERIASRAFLLAKREGGRFAEVRDALKTACRDSDSAAIIGRGREMIELLQEWYERQVNLGEQHTLAAFDRLEKHLFPEVSDEEALSSFGI